MGTPRERLEELRALKSQSDPRARLNKLRELKAKSQQVPTQQVDIGQIQPAEQPQLGEPGGLVASIPDIGGEQALGTIGSAIISEPVAGVAGIIQSLNPLAEPGAGARAVESTREALTFAPDSPQAVEKLQQIAELAEPVTTALSATEKGLGDFAFELTGSPTIAAGATAVPTLILEGLGLASLKKLRTGTRLIDDQGNATKALRTQLDKDGLVFENLTPDARASIPKFADKKLIPGKSEVAGTGENVLVQQIKSGARDDSLAGFKVVNNRIEPDKLGLDAIKQGYSEGFVQAVKSANKETKTGMNKMLTMMRRIKKNERLALEFRPADVMGDSFANRIRFIRDKANTARLELNTIAEKSLRGKQINPAPIVDKLESAMEKLDVDLIDGGRGVPKPVFEGSLISKDRTSQRVVKDLIDLMAEGGAPDALRFHKLKRQLDNMIDFRKKSASGLSEAGKNVLKDIRFALNSELRALSPDYARVNDTLSSSLTALDDFQRVSGSSIDIFGTNANKAIGQDIRGIMSNRKSRVKLENAIDQIESVTADLGGNFTDDLRDLALFANGLDNRFGAVAKTSFKGEIESAIKQTAQQGAKATVVQTAAEKAGKIGQKLRGVNDFNAFEAMNKLLNER